MGNIHVTLLIYIYRENIYEKNYYQSLNLLYYGFVTKV